MVEYIVNDDMEEHKRKSPVNVYMKPSKNMTSKNEKNETRNPQHRFSFTLHFV